jgi:hypothetical protein
MRKRALLFALLSLAVVAGGVWLWSNDAYVPATQLLKD